MGLRSEITQSRDGEGADPEMGGLRGAFGQGDAFGRMMRVRWWIWSILAICYLVVYFQRIAPGVVADRLMADFAVGGAAVGLLTSIYFYLYAAMQIPSGVLADTLGVRYTVSIGILLAGVGSLLFGMAPTLELAYAGRFLVGFGVAVVFVVTLKFQGDWFRAKEFGTVSGLLMLVGNLGAVTATTPVAVMAQTLGWRLSFVVIGAVTCVVGVAAWVWVRDRPADMGLPSIGEVEAATVPDDGSASPAGGSASVSIARGRPPLTQYPAGSAGVSPAPVDALPSEARLPFWTGAGIVWRSRQTWMGSLAHFGLIGSFLTFNGLWAVPYLMHVYGMDRLRAANLLLVASVGLLVSAPLIGYASDNLLRSRRLPIVALGAISCGVWLTMALWNGGKPPVWALYPLFGALGFCGGIVALILAGVKEANPPALSGLAMGTANSGFLSAALLQPTVGYLLDSYWQGDVLAGARVYPLAGYQVMLAILAAFALLGLVGAWQMKETYRQG